MDFSVRQSLKGKHIIMTGATGFLGKVWVAFLLEKTEVAKLSLIVRSNRKKSALERWDEIVDTSPVFRRLREMHGSETRDALDKRVEILAGDVSKPLCGLSAEEARRVVDTVDAVAHVAGLTDFEPDPIAALNINLRGAQHAADLAALTRGKRFVHCSTCFVAGKRSGPIDENIEIGLSPTGVRFDPKQVLRSVESICENESEKRARIDAASTLANELGWPNGYTFTKGLGEHLLLARGDVNVTLVRPSIVEASVSFPFPGWIEGINTSAPICWLVSTPFRKLPAQPKNRFDVVPVDTVARGLTLTTALALADEAKTVYQLASGGTNPFTFKRSIDLTTLSMRSLGNPATGKKHAIDSFVDAVPGDQERKGLLTPKNARWLAGSVKRLARGFDPKSLPPALRDGVGKPLKKRLKKLGNQSANAEKMLGRMEKILDLYKPFIHDYDYEFETDAVFAENARLVADEQNEFTFDIDKLNWRTYWMEQQMPSLHRYSFPLIRGERIELDAPSLPPRAELRDTAVDQASASTTASGSTSLRAEGSRR